MANRRQKKKNLKKQMLNQVNKMVEQMQRKPNTNIKVNIPTPKHIKFDDDIDFTQVLSHIFYTDTVTGERSTLDKLLPTLNVQIETPNISKGRTLKAPTVSVTQAKNEIKTETLVDTSGELTVPIVKEPRTKKAEQQGLIPPKNHTTKYDTVPATNVNKLEVLMNDVLEHINAIPNYKWVRVRHGRHKVRTMIMEFTPMKQALTSMVNDILAEDEQQMLEYFTSDVIADLYESFKGITYDSDKEEIINEFTNAVYILNMGTIDGLSPSVLEAMDNVGAI